MPSHAGEGTARVTWLRRDVDVESCWRQSCRVMLAKALSGRLDRGVMSIPSQVGDSAAESC
jgi:hypothetical protein